MIIREHKEKFAEMQWIENITIDEYISKYVIMNDIEQEYQRDLHLNNLRLENEIKNIEEKYFSHYSNPYNTLDNIKADRKEYENIQNNRNIIQEETQFDELVKEAKDRGFIKGAKIISLLSNNPIVLEDNFFTFRDNMGNTSRYNSNADKNNVDLLFLSQIKIFDSNLGWARIIENSLDYIYHPKVNLENILLEPLVDDQEPEQCYTLKEIRDNSLQIAYETIDEYRILIDCDGSNYSITHPYPEKNKVICIRRGEFSNKEIVTTLLTKNKRLKTIKYSQVLFN